LNGTLFAPAPALRVKPPSVIVRVQRFACRSFFVGATQRLPFFRPCSFCVTVNLTDAASESVKRIVVPFGAELDQSRGGKPLHRYARR